LILKNTIFNPDHAAAWRISCAGPGAYQNHPVTGHFFLDLTEKINYPTISESDTSYFLYHAREKDHMKILRN